MYCAETYMNHLIDALRREFTQRLVYVGLQGSYLREEATESSDIDPMVVIDGMAVADLNVYRTIIEKMDDSQKSCGFICGREELAHWNPLEICHLLHGTKDYYGELARLVPQFTMEDERNFIRLSLNNLYHELCHRYIHADMAKNVAKLPQTYKSAFFILQNLHYLETGVFLTSKKDALVCLQGTERMLLEMAVDMQQGKTFAFRDSFELIFNWCRETISRI